MVTEDSPSPEILYPHWQREYQSVLVEFDPKKLPGLIETAEEAICKRLQQLSHDSDHHTERQVIEDALQSLRFLKKQKVANPVSAASKPFSCVSTRSRSFFNCEMIEDTFPM